MVENSLPHHSFKALRMAENKMAMDWLEKYILSLLKKTTTIHSLFFFNWPISLNPLTQSTYVGRGRRFCVYGTFKSNLITFDGKYAEAACGIVVFWALSPCLVSVIYSACFACAGKHDCAVSPLCRCPQLVLGTLTCQIRFDRFYILDILNECKDPLVTYITNIKTNLSGLI